MSKKAKKISQRNRENDTPLLEALENLIQEGWFKDKGEMQEILSRIRDNERLLSFLQNWWGEEKIKSIGIIQVLATRINSSQIIERKFFRERVDEVLRFCKETNQSETEINLEYLKDFLRNLSWDIEI